MAYLAAAELYIGGSLGFCQSCGSVAGGSMFSRTLCGGMSWLYDLLRRGNRFDYAVAQSFFQLLKRETIRRQIYWTGHAHLS